MEEAVKGLVELTELLSKKGVGFVSLTESIDTTTPRSRFFFHMMTAFAQMAAHYMMVGAKIELLCIAQACLQKEGKPGHSEF